MKKCLIFTVFVWEVLFSGTLSYAANNLISKPSKQNEIVSKAKDLAKTIRANISQAQFLKDILINAFTSLDSQSKDYVFAIEKDFRNNNIRSVKKRIKKFMHDVPDSWLAHFYLSVVYQIEDKKEEAYGEIKKALRLNPDATAAKIVKINLLIEYNEFSLAETMLNEFLAKYTDMPLAIYLRALNYKKSQNFSKAIKDLQYLLKLQPNYRLARCRRSSKRAQYQSWLVRG